MSHELDQNLELGSSAWNQHYKRERARQSYPDENLVRLLAIARRGPALDFGCGSGRHLALLLDLGFEPVFGLDTSSEAIQICKDGWPQASCRRLHAAELKERNFIAGPEDQKFAAAVAWGVLHYNPPEIQQNILRGIARNLHPEGIFVGTLRSHRDSHYKDNQDINRAPMQYFDESQCRTLLGSEFSSVELGYIERTPVGELDRRLAHWVFRCRL